MQVPLRKRYRGLGDTAQIQQMIVASANQYGVDQNIALGVAAHESGFNPNATNHNSNGTTDWGVMQLNDLTVQTMGVSNPLDPQQNIDAGVRLLAQLYAKWGNWHDALWAYASGSGNVGPGKTPNAIAQGFINYVMSYAGGVPLSPGSASGSAPADTSGADTSGDSSPASSDTGADSSSGGDDSGGPNIGMVVGIGAGLAALWILSRLFS